MKKLNRYLMLTVMLTLFVSYNASAKVKNTPIYLFGVATSFADSTIYFTEVQQVDSACLYERSKFVYGRENYSYQLRDYLRAQGFAFPLCITGFATSRTKADKKYMALQKKYMKKGGYNIHYIKNTEFRYSPIVPEPEPAQTNRSQQ